MCGKKYLLLLAMLLGFSSVSFSLSPEEKAIVQELVEMNERLETQLLDRESRLTQVSNELNELKLSLETMKKENDQLMLWWKSHETYDKELKSSLMVADIHRWTATGLFALSLGYNFWQSLNR